MKTVKLTKKMLTLYPGDLLESLGAVNVEAKRAYPQHVYFSKKDYDELTKNVKRLAKKERPDATDKFIANVVGYTMLDLGPNETLADALKPGFAVVDIESIEEAIKHE